MKSIVNEYSGTLTEEEQSRLGYMLGKLSQLTTDFKGAAKTEDSVAKVMAVIEKASIENGDGGANLSHKGNKEWL